MGSVTSAPIVTSAVAPEAAAMPSAVRRTRSSTSSCICGSSVRTVPSIVTASGMMLERTPPSIVPMVTITGALVTLTCRLAMVCRPSTICEATTIGSTPFQGMAPCVERPRTTIFRSSAPAMMPPARQAI